MSTFKVTADQVQASAGLNYIRPIEDGIYVIETDRTSQSGRVWIVSHSKSNDKVKVAFRAADFTKCSLPGVKTDKAGNITFTVGTAFRASRDESGNVSIESASAKAGGK
jgi:hypothetical protein